MTLSNLSGVANLGSDHDHSGDSAVDLMLVQLFLSCLLFHYHASRPIRFGKAAMAARPLSKSPFLSSAADPKCLANIQAAQLKTPCCRRTNFCPSFFKLFFHHISPNCKNGNLEKNRAENAIYFDYYLEHTVRLVQLAMQEKCFDCRLEKNNEFNDLLVFAFWRLAD